jgi:putative permease
MNKTTQKLLIIWSIIFIVLFAVLHFFSEAFILCSIAFLFAFIFEPIIACIERLKISRAIGTIFVFILVGFIIYLLLSFVIPFLSEQVASLQGLLDPKVIQQQIKLAENSLHKSFPFFEKGLIASMITDAVKNLSGNLPSYVSNLVSLIIVIVIFPFIAFFIMKDKNVLIKGFVILFPEQYRDMTKQVIDRVNTRMERYVRGWLIDAAFVGLSCGIGFHLIGIPYAPLLGIIAGCGHLIPYFGPVIGGLPALIISIIQRGDFSAAPWLIVLLVIIYILDNGFVQPYVLSKSTDIHPVIIILLIIAGEQFLGLPGMLLAVPIATAINTAVIELNKAMKESPPEII